VGNVEKGMRSKVKEKGYLHLTLIDPEKEDPNLERVIGELDACGTDGYLVGGSTGFYPTQTEALVDTIKKVSRNPVILFPGGLFGLAKNADAILFLSLLNSVTPYFIVGAQAQAAPLVLRMKIEAIPVGYIVFGKSSVVSVMGMTQEIEPENYKAASAYAEAASLMGMRAVYLEGGSGVKRPIPAETVSRVRSSVPDETLLIVGGGIRSREDAASVVAAGADVVVTGTVVEESGPSSLRAIIEGCEEGALSKRARIEGKR